MITDSTVENTIGEEARCKSLSSWEESIYVWGEVGSAKYTMATLNGSPDTPNARRIK